jgi:putative hydrolase of the HAD superfamily
VLPRAVLFDLGDTLVRLDPFPSDLAARLQPRLAEFWGARDVDKAALAIVTAVADAIAAASREAHRDEVRITDHIARFFADRGVTNDAAACALLSDTWGEADVGRIGAVPGRAAFLGSLRARGLRLGIVSNTTTRGPLLTGMLASFGILEFFDAVVYSSEVGVRKPHRPVYEAALSQLAVHPSETVFVGDRLREDVLGPAALGMTALLTHEFYRAEHSGEPFAVLERLEDLAAILDSLSESTPSDAPRR